MHFVSMNILKCWYVAGAVVFWGKFGKKKSGWLNGKYIGPFVFFQGPIMLNYGRYCKNIRKRVINTF